MSIPTPLPVPSRFERAPEAAPVHLPYWRRADVSIATPCGAIGFQDPAAVDPPWRMAEGTIPTLKRAARLPTGARRLPR